MSCRGDGVPPSDELGGVKRDRKGIGKRGWLVRFGVAIVIAALLFLEVWAFKAEHEREAAAREKYESFTKAPYGCNLPRYGIWFYVRSKEDYEFLMSGPVGRKPGGEIKIPGWYLVVPPEGSGITQEGERVYSYSEVRAELNQVLNSLPGEVESAGEGK